MGEPIPGIGLQPVIRGKARGYGIILMIMQELLNAIQVFISKDARPYSANASNSIKQIFGGDWVVVCYPEQRAYDFDLTTVKGGDFITFTVDNALFQVCRLK